MVDQVFIFPLRAKIIPRSLLDIRMRKERIEIYNWLLRMIEYVIGGLSSVEVK